MYVATVYRERGLLVGPAYEVILHQCFGTTVLAANLALYREMLGTLDFFEFEEDDNVTLSKHRKAIASEADLNKRLPKLIKHLEAIHGDSLDYDINKIEPEELTIEIYNSELLMEQ